MATLHDLQIFRQSVEAFYASFTDADWTRKHGTEWTFADPLYHLTTLQAPILEGIRGGEIMEDISKLRDMNAWNNAQFAQRFPSLTPRQVLADFLASWRELEQAAQMPPETRVYMPLMRLRGERPLDLLLEYALWHAWLHITESSIRLKGQLLPLPAALQSRMVEFFFIVMAGAVDRQAAKTPFIWAIRITGDGGGAWTMRFANGTATVERGADPHADVSLTTDLITLLKTTAYQIQSPVRPILTRRMRFRGWMKLRHLMTMVIPRSSREWAPLPEEYELLPAQS